MEKITNKYTAVLIMVLLIMIFIPKGVMAGTIEGTVQGFTCVTQGIFCPKGKEDPMAGVERVFVVLTKDHKYFFIPNLDRAVMARLINDHVRVSGKISFKFQAITARHIEVYNKGTWRSAWSLEEEIKLRRKWNHG